MTTLTESPPPAEATALPAEFAELTDRLDQVGGRMRLAATLRAGGHFLLLALPLVLVVLFIAGRFSCPAWLNGLLLIALLVALSIAYVRLLHGALFHRPTYAEIARSIEQNANPDLPLNNELINAVLLARDWSEATAASAHPAPAWIPHVLRELNQSAQSLPLERAIRWSPARNALLLAAVAMALCGLVVVKAGATLSHGLAVLAHPASFVPRQGAVKILAVEPGDDTLLAGQSVTFAITVDAPEHKPVDTRISLTFASGKTLLLPMTPFGADNTRYRYELPTVAEGIDYVVTAGDTQSAHHHLTVLPQVHLTHFSLTGTPPAYTGLPPRTIALAGNDVTIAKASTEFPLGSAVTLSVSVDLPVKQALLETLSGEPLPLTDSGDGKTFTAGFPLKDTLRYAIRLNDNANRTLRRFPETDPTDTATAYAITATPDAPPTIAVTEPGKDIDAKPGDKLSLTAQATDDYGLTEVSLEVARNDEKEFHALQRWPLKPAADGKPVRAATARTVLEFPAGDYKLGDLLHYRFVATDNRTLTAVDPAWAPQSTPGQVFTVTFNDTAAMAAKTTRLWDELRKQLNALLDRQIALRKEAGALLPSLSIADCRKLTAPITEGQKSLRADMNTLAASFAFEPSMKLVQKSLQVLVVEDATNAVDRSADILLLSQTSALTPLATRLRQHQSRIIDVLQTLLAIAAADEHHDAKAADHEGGDLPSDARDTWKKLADEMKKFEKEQKAVIDASADLAKKPKDQYDANDSKKVADLAAIEDKWEKFLNNRLADVSKIAEQDQANASLLDEMVQMKVELAAAKNALDQKAVEIATPLEENGLENAKALDTHIERMLMQTPDHQAWQMEEAVTQNDPQMAELPKQLQDMVGDLMDNEEDLTDEMESTASKFADSINKGAGWDAADGPISNMSAQGVTGNQMPKNDEIQGRSGEGREGRSSGEFVGAEAEGKGGRRTPTRMTDEPFSSGQVQDKSKDPAGGATGGGKKGGFGGEGLEGSAPPELQNVTQRLQGSQASLRNGAERLALQMHAAGFDNFKLLEANVLLKKSEDALKQYHYQTALYYQQEAVQSLNTAKVLAAGQVHVITDSSPTASEKTQKEMETALNGTMPRGYADPVKAYFQKLSAETPAP